MPEFRIHELSSDDGDPMGFSDWEREASFLAAAEAFRDEIVELGPKALDHQRWDYVQLIPMEHYRAYYYGNAGAQGWRHHGTGWTIPDYCRQQGGCPEVWTRTNQHVNLEIAEDSPVLGYVVNW